MAIQKLRPLSSNKRALSDSCHSKGWNRNRYAQMERLSTYATDLHAYYKRPKLEAVARISDYPATA